MKWERIRHHTSDTRHNQAVAAIEKTPPIDPANDGLVLFSMIGNAVVRPYLVAVKSLWQQLGRGRVVLLDDGTLTRSDKTRLRRHVGDPAILSIHDVDTGPCPTGGAWARLLTVLDLRTDNYVIQLDSDTVTLGDIPEIARAVDRNRSFTLAGGIRAAEIGRVAMSRARQVFHPGGARAPTEGNIQAAIECAMPDLGLKRRKYVRGCSGFTGFASGGSGRETVEEFSQAAETIMGSRWHERGTEQVASSYTIANDRNPLVLPYEHYSNYSGKPWNPDMRFVHFVGTHRHSNGAYKAASQKAIERLF